MAERAIIPSSRMYIPSSCNEILEQTDLCQFDERELHYDQLYPHYEQYQYQQNLLHQSPGTTSSDFFPDDFFGFYSSPPVGEFTLPQGKISSEESRRERYEVQDEVTSAHFLISQKDDPLFKTPSFNPELSQLSEISRDLSVGKQDIPQVAAQDSYNKGHNNPSKVIFDAPALESEGNLQKKEHRIYSSVSGLNDKERGPFLWEFIARLIVSKEYNPSVLEWVDESQYIFKVNDKQQLGRLWGARCGRTVTYSNLSRGLRYHYGTGYMEAVKRQRMTYRFGKLALEFLDALSRLNIDD